jgi:hypothetical protein
MKHIIEVARMYCISYILRRQGFVQAKATVLVLAVPSQYENARQSSGKFSLAVQLLPNSDYQVK